MSDKLRLRFEKTGRAVYISHLDLMHTMQRAFNRARVLEAYEPQRKVAELKWLQVEGRFDYDERDPGEMAAALEEFYRQEAIVITKKTKRGMGETDIRPGIREIRFAPGEREVNITSVISAQEPTINPELLAEALRQLRPEIAPDFAKFTRIETYDAEMKVYR